MIAASPKPSRIQRKRARGWKTPDNTVYVGRMTKWGNPFVINPHVKAGSKHPAGITVQTREQAIECYKEMFAQRPDMIKQAQKELAGKNLACWCPLDKPCHADVLLEVANKQTINLMTQSDGENHD